MPTDTCGRSGGRSGALITQTFLGTGFCIDIPRKSKANHPQPGSSGEGVGVHFRQRGSLLGNLALELGREGIKREGSRFRGFPTRELASDKRGCIRWIQGKMRACGITSLRTQE